MSTSLQKAGGGRAGKKFSITGEAFGVGADEVRVFSLVVLKC